MRKIFVILTALCCSMVCSAQATRVSKFEGGFYVGATSPIGSFHNADPKIGPMMGVDFRYNFENTPWDCGAYLEIGTGKWDFYKNGSDYYQNNRTTVFGLSSHYNFRQGTLVNPYAGLGLGIALNDVVGQRLYPSKHYSLAVSPRIGVELLRHIRVGCQAEITRQGFLAVALTVGVAFGGGKKK